MASKILKIMEKNLKILQRKKTAVFVILLLPLIIVLLLGFAYSGTESYYINVGVHASSYEGFPDTIIHELESNQFSITRYPLEEACIDGVKSGETNVCLFFPGKKMAAGAKDEIIFHVDYSDIGLVYNIIDSISSRISEKSEEISQAIAEDLIARLAAAEIEVNTRVPTIVRLTNDNDVMFSSTKGAIADLQSLDLQFEEGKFPIVKLEKEFDAWRDLATRTVFESNLLIAKLQSELDKLDCNKSGLESVLKESGQTFDFYETELEEVNATLETLIEDMNSAISETRQKFEAAATVRINATLQMEDIKSTLGQSLSKLNNVQAGLNNIKRTVSAFGAKDATALLSPIDTTIEPITEKKTHFNYIFPTLIVVLLLVTGVVLGASLSMAEKSSPAYFRNMASPTRTVTFIFTSYLTGLLTMIVQAVIFMAIALFFFKTELLSVIFPLCIVLVIIASTFILIGIFMSSFFRSRSMNALGSMTLAIVMLLFSSTLLPMESMPLYFKQAASFNPFVLGEQLLKETIFYNFGLIEMKICLLILSGYCIFFFLGSVLLQKNLKLHMLYHIHKLQSERLVSSFKHKVNILFAKKVEKQIKEEPGLLHQPVKSPMERALLHDARKQEPIKKCMKDDQTNLDRLKRELKKL